MNDRFKFRAYWKKEKKFIQGLLISFKISGVGDTITVYEKGKKSFALFIGLDVELIQCTGLKDKNGKLIFEGDIVKTDANYIGQVVFREYMWSISIIFEDLNHETHGVYLNFYDLNGNGNTLEIIGNIYENTEMNITPPKNDHFEFKKD